MANTPGRLIRVEDELWDDYGKACDAKGTTRSDDLRAHMATEVETWKSDGDAESQ
jgi:hypothetical protein